MKKVFLLVAAALADFAASAAEVLTSNGITYSVINENEVAVIRNYYSGSIVIPSSISENEKTYTVTSIGDSAFYGCNSLTNITCLAMTPPDVSEESSFTNYNAYVYVPCESIEEYKNAEYWKNFTYIECLALKTVELCNDDAMTIVVVNNQITVNGETPEFVYTLLGQKVSNNNLKSGVYMVSIAGQSNKVLIP